MKWGFFAFLIYQIRLSVDSIAGKTTITSIIMSLGTRVSVTVGLSWAVTALFAIWVFFERRLRKDTTERLSLRVQDLELSLDRRRSSSRLTPRGDTRPEDQL